MPIGNQEIWDKGIGAGATNVVFGGGDTQPSLTNFNPGALGADPTQKPVAAATPSATPAAPALGQPPVQEEQIGPTEEQIQQMKNLQSAIVQAQSNLNSAQAGHTTELKMQGLRQRLIQAQNALQQFRIQNGM